MGKSQEIPVQNDPKPSSISDFRAYFEKFDKPQVVKLPKSGLSVEFKQIDLTNMVLGGHIGNDMFPVLAQIQSGGRTVKDLSTEDFKMFANFVNLIFVNSVTNPQFTNKPSMTDDKLDVNKIPFEDRAFLMEIVTRGEGEVKDNVASFREEPIGASAGSDVQEVQPKTKPSAKNKVG